MHRVVLVYKSFCWHECVCICSVHWPAACCTEGTVTATRSCDLARILVAVAADWADERSPLCKVQAGKPRVEVMPSSSDIVSIEAESITDVHCTNACNDSGITRCRRRLVHFSLRMLPVASKGDLTQQCHYTYRLSRSCLPAESSSLIQRAMPHLVSLQKNGVLLGLLSIATDWITCAMGEGDKEDN